MGRSLSGCPPFTCGVTEAERRGDARTLMELQIVRGVTAYFGARHVAVPRTDFIVRSRKRRGRRIRSDSALIVVQTDFRWN